MIRSEIQDKVQQVIAEDLSIEAPTLNEKLSFTVDLGYDAIRLGDLAVKLGKAFGSKIPLRTDRYDTIGDLVDQIYLCRSLKA